MTCELFFTYQEIYILYFSLFMFSRIVFCRAHLLFPPSEFNLNATPPVSRNLNADELSLAKQQPGQPQQQSDAASPPSPRPNLFSLPPLAPLPISLPALAAPAPQLADDDEVGSEPSAAEVQPVATPPPPVQQPSSPSVPVGGEPVSGLLAPLPPGGAWGGFFRSPSLLLCVVYIHSGFFLLLFPSCCDVTLLSSLTSHFNHLPRFAPPADAPLLPPQLPPPSAAASADNDMFKRLAALYLAPSNP